MNPLLQNEKIIFEYNKKGCSGVDIPDCQIKKSFTGLPERTHIGLPELSEQEVVRHFTRLSRLNYSLDMGMYPLGSCTMKYNPKLNDKLAGMPEFADIHPLQDESSTQGSLEAMHLLQTYLAELSGLPNVALSPAAGAHGELAGLKIIKAAHKKLNLNKKTIIIPDSAHGTNPATASMCGYNTITIKSNEKGMITKEMVANVISDDTAAIMLTLPNTCGVFDEDVLGIADLIHKANAYFYCDGANFNALVGKIRPADFGADIMHFNLHKTFSSPHGAGGPGAGPIAVSDELKKFLPLPYVIKKTKKYSLVTKRKDSIGRIKAFHGHFSVMLRALSYIISCGIDGLQQVSEDAILSANYVLHKLKNHYHAPFGNRCMHEFVITDAKQNEKEVNANIIAKSLIQNGIHPMTVYFPLIVQGAMLVEPTETESKETLDNFINVMIKIANEATSSGKENLIMNPSNTPVSLVDETVAARNPKLCC